MAETFNNQSTKLTSTSGTTVYQAPNASGNKAIVLSSLVANVDGSSTATLTLYITSSSSSSSLSHICKTLAVPPDASIELIPNKLVLTQGQRLRAIAGSSNDLEVTVSALEIT